MALKRVLLAEDDPDDRELFCKFIQERKDIELLATAVDGGMLLQLLDEVNSEQNLPDMIILDHNMPKMTGLEVLNILKDRPRYAHIPVLVYSTYADHNFTKKFKEAGAVAVVSKPVTANGYREMIDEFMRAVPSA